MHTTPNDHRSFLKHKISSEVFVSNRDTQIEIFEDPNHWLFDFRAVLMQGETAHRVAELFYEYARDRYPFQLSTLEVGGIPLLASIVTNLYHRGLRDINGFFIRKSRKKSGLMQMVEGTILPDVPIIMVDDLLNSGSSFLRQLEVLDGLGHRVIGMWTILRFRDPSYYRRFTNRGITVDSCFSLDDFTDVLGETVKNLTPTPTPPPRMPFHTKWLFASPNPSHYYVAPKSQPILDDRRLFYGSDDRTFWALNQHDGSVAWKYRVGPGSKKKSIFSCPAIAENLVIFGSYDGNVYALDRATGKRVWVSFDADWIGSSPAVAPELGLVFIGLEFGLFKKHGGIAALDLNTGATVWADTTHPALTHSSPCYIGTHKQVIIGSNDGVARLYNARTGERIWSFTTFGGGAYNPAEDAGFGKGDIKGSFVYDPARDLIIFGSIDGFLYVLDRARGHLVHHERCEFGIIGTPYLANGHVYYTSLDKRLRCLSLAHLKVIFDVCPDNTRIFSSPTIIQDRLYVGTNAGRLHELDPVTGKQLGYFQARERITNTLIYNPTLDTYFLPTYANEIYALSRDHETTLDTPPLIQPKGG